MTQARVIVCGRAGDPSVRLLVERGARLLTPVDMLVAGWRHDPADPARDMAIIDGQPWPVSTIDGVVARLDHVSPADLPTIRAIDRAYVAAELSAFLRSWLCALPCPVVHRPWPPTPLPEAWTRLAARLGIPVVPIERRTTPRVSTSSDSVQVVVVGDEVFSATHDPTLEAHARRLAAAGGTTLLSVEFSLSSEGARFVRANGSPVLTPAHADALWRSLLSSRSNPATALRKVAT